MNYVNIGRLGRTAKVNPLSRTNHNYYVAAVSVFRLKITTYPKLVLIGLEALAMIPRKKPIVPSGLIAASGMLVHLKSPW